MRFAAVVALGACLLGPWPVPTAAAVPATAASAVAEAPSDAEDREDPVVGRWRSGSGVIGIEYWAGHSFHGYVVEPITLGTCTYRKDASSFIWTLTRFPSWNVYEGRFFPLGGPQCRPVDTQEVRWMIGTPGGAGDDRNVLSMVTASGTFRFTRVRPILAAKAIMLQRSPTRGQPPRLLLLYTVTLGGLVDTLIVTDLDTGLIVGRATSWWDDDEHTRHMSTLVSTRARPDHSLKACVTSRDSYQQASKTACVHFALKLLPNNKWIWLSRPAT